MSRFETRYAARIKRFVDVVMEQVRDDLFPNLEAIVAEQETDEQIIPVIPIVHADDAADRISRIFGRITVFAEQFLPESRIHDAAERSAVEVNAANKAFNEENVRTVLGVDVLSTDPWLSTEIEHFTNENVSLVQGLTTEQIADIEQAVFRLVQRGAGPKEIRENIQSIMDTTTARAKLIARDQVGKFNGRLSQLRQKQLGIEEYIWRTSDDERVRPTHQALDNNRFSWDNPPVTVTSGKRAGERNHPGQDIQCLPADSNVVLRQGAGKLFRRAYRGKLTTLVTDDGSTVSATPHHPIFTGNSWVRIGSVQVGEKIFKARRQRDLAGENDVQQSDILICDIFDAALKVFPPPMREAGVAGQFHGDGTDEEICIINTDSRLPDEPDAPLDHHFCEEILTGSDQRIPDLFLDTFSPPEFALMGLWPTSDSIVRGARKLFSLFTTQLSHADEHRVAAASWLNPILQQAIADNRSAHSIFFGESLLAFPGKVVGDDRFAVHILSIMRSVSLADRCIDTPTAEQLGKCVGMTTDIRRGVFDAGAIADQPLRVVQRFDWDHDGPVFNIETLGGWYAADDYILKNCRCIAEPVFRDERGREVA